MNPVILYIFFWVVRGLSKINDSCSFMDDRSKKHTGLCRTKTVCLGSGLAAISLNATGDKLCPGDDDSLHCCIDIKCGVHQCRNNVQGNSCVTGAYLNNSRNHVYCPSPSSDDNIQCCVESEKHHEIRAVNDYEVWGFDTFDPPDVTDISRDLDAYLDNTNSFGDSDSSFDDSSDFKVAQMPEGINVENNVDNGLDYQTWNMDKIPEVQNLQPKYQDEDYEEDVKPLKNLKGGKKASYLRIDYFNNRIAPGLRISDDRSDGNDWSPSFTDERNGGPGIATGGVNLGWSAQFEGPQMIYDFQH